MKWSFFFIRLFWGQKTTDCKDGSKSLQYRCEDFTMTSSLPRCPPDSLVTELASTVKAGSVLSVLLETAPQAKMLHLQSEDEGLKGSLVFNWQRFSFAVLNSLWCLKPGPHLLLPFFLKSRTKQPGQFEWYTLLASPGLLLGFSLGVVLLPATGNEPTVCFCPALNHTPNHWFENRLLHFMQT